ncbi:O-methyltransferase [Saprospira sp. CCB-QB6]|uniref:O-methyltransferase n=1 Tax=Saprospira sp. CCB-QB6 TaxID=3023936 RepID=UPI0023495AFE|nr:O-methyltransferase [Saprospira sp. CCB-QB6]WCL82579.1 O-methyltransferase [Saprospira sp. CCB-QB6]
MLDFPPKNIQTYCEQHSEAFPAEILKEIERYTHLHVLMPQMISGQVQGHFLALLSKLLAPKKILEVGTFTGYSAICLAQGLQPGGRLLTLDINEELEDAVNGFFKKAGLEQKIELRIGAALDIIPELSEDWDLAFIDADKMNYDNYYELILPKMRPGGCILIDNVLWSGKVAEPELKGKKTIAIDALNKKIMQDPRVERVLLPFRDGMLMIRKK